MNHTTLKLPTSHKATIDSGRITRNKLIIVSCLTFIGTYIDGNSGFGGGFATGAILGTGITLAATSGARNANRNPYYKVDRMKARQEEEAIAEENKLKKEENKRHQKLERQQAEEERRLEHKRNQLAKENRKIKHETPSSKDQSSQIDDSKTTHEKTHAHHISHKEHEIKKLELEIKKIELEQLQAAAAAA